MMKIIADWLNGRRNYTVGCILYNRFGSDDELKILFERGKTDFTESKLLECLKEMVVPTKKEEKIKEVAVEKFPESKNKVLISLRDQWMPFYTEMNYKRHQLDKFLFQKTDAAMKRRAKLAMDILNLEKRCMFIWQQRDHYIEFGRLPQQEKAEPVIDPGRIAERYIKVQSYLRKYKMHIRREPGNPRFIALLQKYENEFEVLKKQRK